MNSSTTLLTKNCLKMKCPRVEGYEKSYLSDLGAVNVFTGEYTGRSPKDKFIVEDDTTRDTFWWNGTGGTKNDNKPITQDTWNDLKKLLVISCRIKNYTLLMAILVRIRIRP